MNVRVAARFTPALLILFPAVVSAQPLPPSSGDQVTFKAETNLVLVPVVVRDSKGNAVGNLRKEDFQLFDKGKPQVVATFAVEETSGQVAQDRSLPDANTAPANSGAANAQAKAAAMVIPEHYVALLFDDLHFKIGNPGPPPGYIGDAADMWYARDAARKMLKTLKPADRVSVFTSSGQVMLDFTADRAKIEEALLKLRPGKPVLATVANSGLAGRELEDQTQDAVKWCGNVVRRMSHLPGQRTLVFISPGLLLQGTSWSAVGDTMSLIDQAIRSRVVVNSLDARGLSPTPLRIAGPFQEFQMRVTDGTGGTYIRDANDLNGAMERLAATPKYIYVLGFSPQGIKEDGSFHALTVKLVSGHKLDVQARAGYMAPDAKELARRRKQPVSPDKAAAVQVDEAETKAIAAAIGIAPATKVEAHPEAALATAPAPVPPKASSTALAPTAPVRTEEITTHDEPVTFKVQSNLVEVPVIVRDRQGHAVGNLRQEDFRVFDKGKQQPIAKFSVQKAAAPTAPEAHAENAPAEGAHAESAHASGLSNGSAAPPVFPHRFIAFVFDDVNIRSEDLPQVRAAVERYVNSSLGPQDRVALFTTSGQIGVDFTGSREALSGPLLKIAPNPIAQAVYGSCGTYVSYFQAVQIDQQVGLQPSPSDVSKCLALRVAVEEYVDFHTAMQYVRDAYTSGLQETRAALATLKIVVQRMAAMPGQRSVVLVSPGFFVPADLQQASSDLMELAIRSKVVVSSIDARGVWTMPSFDPCRGGAPANVIQDEVAFRQLEAEANTDELLALAEDTGGTANRNNDFDGGVRKAAAAPEYLYLLGFVPQDLKLDGSFHTLKVIVNSSQKASLQVRRGYWAPKHAEDELAVSKQEIESAVFSREEIHNLPVEMHTQVTKTGEQAKLNVLASVDLKLIHLRKADDRNRNDVTIVAALFDSNGNFIAGQQKILQLRLLDDTVQTLERRPPVTIDTNFDVHPGAYLVRLVARDAEGQELTAENASVQIQ